MIILILLVLLFAGSAEAQTTLGAAAASLSAGQWTQITAGNTAILRVGGHDNDVFPFAVSAVWDASRGQIYFGGNDHGYPDKRWMYYDEATNNWNLIGSFGGTIDTHGYDHIAINTYTHEIYLAPYGLGGTFSVTKWTGGPSGSMQGNWSSFNCGYQQVAVGSGFWSGALTGATNGVGAYILYSPGEPTGALCIVNPANGNLIQYLTNWKTYQSPGADYHAFFEYSTIRNVGVFGGGNTMAKKVWRLNANATITALTDAPGSVVLGVQRGLVTEDPITGNLLVLSGGQFWELNPTGSGTWTQLPNPPAYVHSPDSSGNGDVVAVPVPTYGVIVYLWCNASSCTTAIYKHGTGAVDSQAPSIPGSLVATAVNNTINTTWVASTDNVAVTGYGVERCQGAGCSNFVQVYTPVGNLQSDPSLAYPVTYCYRVRARDAAGNWSNYSNTSCATTSAPPSDTTAPTAPTNLGGTVISATAINLTWTASTDNVAVTQYNIERCTGVGCSNLLPIGTSTTASYGATGLTASTTYGWRVQAQDAAGNKSGYSNIIYLQTPAAGGSDFANRCAAAGVIRCNSFDTQADLGTIGPTAWGKNFGVFNGNVSNCPTTGANQCPVIDAIIKAGGTGSMRFTIPTNSGSSGSGQFFTNFSSDLTTQFGANQEFWIQYRQRFSPCFLYQGTDDANCLSNGTPRSYSGAGGWKLADISTGDVAGVCQVNGTNCATSCTDLEIVIQNTVHRGFLQGYHGCPGTYNQSSYPFEELFNGTDFKLQNAYLKNGNPGWCPYTEVTKGIRTNCLMFFPNEWLTYKFHVRIGTYTTGGVCNTYQLSECYPNSLVEFWQGHDGGPMIKTHSMNMTLNASPGESGKWGKIWLLPYNTSKSSGEVHPEAYTWYDELIISTQDIADPGGGTPPPPPTGLTVHGKSVFAGKSILQ